MKYIKYWLKFWNYKKIEIEIYNYIFKIIEIFESYINQ